MWEKGFRVCLVAVLLCAACSQGVEQDSMQSDQSLTENVDTPEAGGVEPVAMTEYGSVIGTHDGDVYAFKGIRYGADTSTTRFAAAATPAT